MKSVSLSLVFLILIGNSWLVDAGRHDHREFPKGSGRKGEGKFHSGQGRRRHSDYYHDERRDSRTQSRHRRRRRSRSEDSRSPPRRKSSVKPPRGSPGYEEYKKQKKEAETWQERRMQAQALVACLEEREQQRAQSSASAGQLGPANPVLPPPPTFAGAGQGQQEAPCDTIPISILRLVEAEMDHAVAFGNSPLNPPDFESKLLSAKVKGKCLDAFIQRYGKKAAPTRIPAKAKLITAIVRELQF